MKPQLPYRPSGASPQHSRRVASVITNAGLALAMVFSALPRESQAEVPQMTPTKTISGAPFKDSVAEMVARDQAAAAAAVPGAEPVILDEPRGELPPKQAGQGAAAAGPAPKLPTSEAAQVISTNFQTISLQDQFTDLASGSIPPDTHGAVGPNHFVEIINSSAAIYTRAGVRLSHVSLASFFTATISAVTYPRLGAFDPRVIFDRRSGRWMAVTLERGAVSGQNNHVILAVSATDDPTGVWNKYLFPVGVPTAGADTFFSDYDTLGTDDNGVYVGVSIFKSTSGSFVSVNATIAAVPKAQVLAAGLATVSLFAGITDMYSVPQPAHNQDAVGPLDRAWFVTSSNTVFGNIMYRRLTWAGAVPTLDAVSTAVTTPLYANPINAPASGSGTAINVGDDRIQGAMIRNGSLWASRQIGVNATGTNTSANRTACEWIQLNVTAATATLTQSGRVFDPAAATPFFYFYPSIMVNGQGHAVMGFSGVQSTGFVGAYFTGRLNGDAAGTMGTVDVIKAGEAAYQRLDTSGRNRWGDYSYTSLDPNDDMSIWTIQEYAENVAANIWGTQVAKTLSAPPATPLSCSPASVAPGLASVSVTVTGSVISGSGFYDPGAGYLNRIAGAVTGVTVNSITYNSPTSVTLNLNTTAATAGAKDVTITNPDGQARTGVGIFSVVGVAQLGAAISVFADAGTLGFTVPAGTNRLLVVTASGVKATDVTSVSFGSTALTQAVERTDTFAVDSIWVLPMGTSASSVTDTITIATNSSASPNERYISAVVFGGVDQTTPTSSPQSAIAISTNMTLNVSSAVGDMVYDVMDAYAVGSLPGISLTSGQTLVTEKTTSVAVFSPGYPSGGFQRNANSSKAGAASVTMSWTSSVGTNLANIHAAINIKAAAGVSPPAPVPVTGSLGSVITSAFAPNGAGANDGTKFDDLLRGGFLAQNGNIVFPGTLEIGTGGVTDVPPNSNFEAIWKHNGTTLNRLARTNDNAPETGGTPAQFGILPLVPAINDLGEVTFLASLKPNAGSTPPTTPDNDTGLWSELGSTGLQTLIREGDQIPGLPAGTLVGNFGTGCFATAKINATDGESAFTITMKGASTDTALLRCSPVGTTTSTVQVVARQNAASPVAGQTYGPLNSNSAGSVRMDAQGGIAFAAQLQPSSAFGLFYQPRGGVVVKAFIPGETAPGTTTTFRILEIPSMGDSGTISFHAYLNASGDNAGSDRNDGIWRGTTGGGFTNILRHGDTNALRPGLALPSAAAKVGNIWGGWLNNNNRGAWRGWVDVAGDGSTGYPADKLGIYTDASGTMALIIKSDDPAPGVAGANIVFIDHPVSGGAAANNFTAFTGKMTGAVTAANDKGVWRSLNGAAPVLVLRTGDSITTTQGVKVVADIDIPGSNEPEQRIQEQPVMDSTGRLLVVVTFTDGSSSQVLVP